MFKLVQFAGTYGIAERIDFNQSKIELAGSSSHRFVLRDSHVHDHPGTGSLVSNSAASHVVIQTDEINTSGVLFTGLGTRHVWILDNHIHHNSGEPIQFCQR